MPIATKPQHSQTPWDKPIYATPKRGASSEAAFIIVGAGKLIASILFNPSQGDDIEECRADADRIVRCVNSHDALVDALNYALAYTIANGDAHDRIRAALSAATK